MLASEFTGGYPSFTISENNEDLLVGKTLLHENVIMWLMKTLLTLGCTNQRGAGHERFNRTYRTEILDFYLFRTLNEAREITER